MNQRERAIYCRDLTKMIQKAEEKGHLYFAVALREFKDMVHNSNEFGVIQRLNPEHAMRLEHSDVD